MSSSILEAIRDWCIGKFQTKGDYLTSVPDGYVTETELEAKNYATKDEISSGEAGVTTEEVKGLINASFLENMGGTQIMQDAEGNWGYKVPGADTVTPFNFGGPAIATDIDVMAIDIDLAGFFPILTEVNYSIADGYEQIES